MSVYSSTRKLISIVITTSHFRLQFGNKCIDHVITRQLQKAGIDNYHSDKDCAIDHVARLYSKFRF